MTKLKNPPSYADAAWKHILDCYFQQFMEFFFPVLAKQIDWTKPVEFMDKELQAITAESMIGQRFVDTLVKVYSKEGHPIGILLSTEIQAKQEAEFSNRLYVYNYRIYDRYQLPVMTLAVLADNNPNLRPTQYLITILNQPVNLFQFQTVKLLDWAGQETGRLRYERG